MANKIRIFVISLGMPETSLDSIRPPKVLSECAHEPETYLSFIVHISHELQ